MKRVLSVHKAPRGHWVGDGFPVRTVFTYDSLGAAISPFLMLDYAGPAKFPPTDKRLGVGEHPHRGFETVTVIYQGEVEHRDSAGHSGRIGPGDVQWMTAASGVLHEEMHGRAFARTGGMFEMVQLWVNLPAKEKMSPPRYQDILGARVPEVSLPGGAGSLRVIAGRFRDVTGPARTVTPLELWDMRLRAGATVEFSVPEGHTAALFVLHGQIRVNGSQAVKDAELALLDAPGKDIQVAALEDALVLILGGEPIDEPLAGYGPFVMNTEEEIQRAVDDYRNGRMGRLPVLTPKVEARKGQPRA